MKLGIIGYGIRIQKMVKEMQKVDASCQVAAIVDHRNGELQQKLDQTFVKNVTFYRSPEDMMAEGKVDAILIGTRCDSHADLAIRTMSSGLPVYLEKPVATHLEDLHQLKAAYEASNNDKVCVSFPRRSTPIVRFVKEVIDSGKIGTVEHVQATNNVPYGGVYFHDWYRDESVTGGLFLQKATHDFDYINFVVGLRPTTICAMTSKQIMKGNKPAGLKCVDCDEKDTCEESQARPGSNPRWSQCCFAEDTGNEDSGSAIIRYESGMHAAYTQNFFVRNESKTRGSRFMGYKGTLEFDFYTETVTVFMHHTSRVETYKITTPEFHHNGGDEYLAKNFIEVVKGHAKPWGTLEGGMLSALMCIKARESARTNTFQDIVWND